MAGETRTYQRRPNGPRPNRNPLFLKMPPQYYQYARKWCLYPRWTVEETANLLTGCVPQRPMFLRGEQHKALDDEVLTVENQIRLALGKGLKVVENRRYFERIYLDSRVAIDWARQVGIAPEALLRADQETLRHRELHGYSTPCMEAIAWVVERYWSCADLRDPPTGGEIIVALLQQFPLLSPEECEMVEHITRHPVAREGADAPDAH